MAALQSLTLDHTVGGQGQPWAPLQCDLPFAKIGRPHSTSTAIVAAPCDSTACKKLASSVAFLLGSSSALTLTFLCKVSFDAPRSFLFRHLVQEQKTGHRLCCTSSLAFFVACNLNCSGCLRQSIFLVSEFRSASPPADTGNVGSQF